MSDLNKIALKILSKGKGILAADESNENYDKKIGFCQYSFDTRK